MLTRASDPPYGPLTRNSSRTHERESRNLHFQPPVNVFNNCQHCRSSTFQRSNDPIIATTAEGESCRAGNSSRSKVSTKFEDQSKNQLHFQSFYLHVLATVPSIKKPVLSLDDNITYPYVPFLETYLHFVKLAFPTSLEVGGPVGSHDLPGPLDVLSVVSSRISSSFKGRGVGWRCQMLVLSLLGLR